ncbi:roadblock/LC7 domain-containing protein [Allonocardiopsis opalescens]|uniref:Putative regulator of Ras-like GTPase activity (Roadblock/LC7/MglB family) n=1 Tax=Allonocardiopsis opalescens TaxID=1144618 RepID=A0A2T0PS53_9ACTN|nr:roadblock/LC7 domain-containing protein [Allonocardiopsis opalescens]PRX91730.1 putative regulator of Ras-like GTPase activity (Roadblock/LC7/MglB family) [Allonocardiopsis opalescens]
MVEQGKAAKDLDWLLDDMRERVPGVQHAIVLSADGLLIGRSASLSREDGEHLSAMASAFQSLARGAGRHFSGGAVRQTVVEMEQAFLFVTAAGHGACLAVLGAEHADVGMIAYEMNLMVRRVGQSLASMPRVAAAGAAAGNAAPLS